MTPFANPMTAPTARTRSTAATPRLLSFIPLSTVIDRITAAKREHPFDREIYRSHQDDEGLAETEDEGYRRVLAHAHEIAKAEEVVVDSGDDRTQENENRRRRPGRRPPAPPCPGRRACRGRKIKRCAQGRDLSANRLGAARLQPLALRARPRVRGRPASCTGSVRSRGPRCRSSQPWAPP